MSALQRLVPIPLPFMVSPSVSHLELTISESPTDAPTTVGFSAAHVDGSSSRAQFVFVQGLFARLLWAYSDGEVVREADYDWSLVPQLRVEHFESDMQRQDEEWERTGLCADPNAYEVLGSAWLAEYGYPGLRHYLIVGHDAYVEVLAEGWRVEHLSERKMLTVEAFESGDYRPAAAVLGETRGDPYGLFGPDELPDGFAYPPEFVRVVALGLVRLEPWWVLTGNALRERRAALAQLLPRRVLVPFARRQASGEVVCWEVGRAGPVVVRDDRGAGGGDEVGFPDFGAWLRGAVGDLLAFG